MVLGRDGLVGIALVRKTIALMNMGTSPTTMAGRNKSKACDIARLMMAKSPTVTPIDMENVRRRICFGISLMVNFIDQELATSHLSEQKQVDRSRGEVRTKNAAAVHQRFGNDQSIRIFKGFFV